MNYTQDEVNEIYGCDMSLFDIPVDEIVKIFKEELTPELAEKLIKEIM